MVHNTVSACVLFIKACPFNVICFQNKRNSRLIYKCIYDNFNFFAVYGLQLSLWLREKKHLIFEGVFKVQLLKLNFIQIYLSALKVKYKVVLIMLIAKNILNLANV